MIDLLDLRNNTVLHREFILHTYVQRQIDINLVRAVLDSKLNKPQTRVNEIKDSAKYEIPILALIKTSTTALLEFLSNWLPYPDFESQPTPNFISPDEYGPLAPIFNMLLEAPQRYSGTIEHILFRLVYITISDLITHWKVLSEDSIVEKAYIGSGRKKRTDKTFPILRLKLKNGATIDFNGGTDTEHYSKTDIPTEFDYWLDVNISVKDGNIDDNLDIDSREWRKKEPEKVRYPAFHYVDDIQKYGKLTNFGGTRLVIG